MAADIQQILNAILTSVYGRDMRQHIHDGIEACYNANNNAVRFDRPQTLTYEQIIQARANIDAANTHQVVRTDVAQSLGEDEIIRARANIDAASETELQALEKALRSRFRGKKISIIGDSIDTFDQAGYKIDGYAMYYPALGVDSVEKTWWKQVIDASGAELEVNASWSGSRVTNTASGYGSPVPDFYGRVSRIGSPDVVFVTLGTNDSAYSVPLGEYDFTTSYENLPEGQFRQAYIKGVRAIKAAHPSAQIVCIVQQMGQAYKDSIAYIAKELSVDFIDASDYVGQSSVHPGVYGMRQIATLVLYPTDFNLWQKHYPADAEATGQKIAEAKRDVGYIVSNEFSSDSAYSVGQFVLHNGQLFVFKKNHVAGTLWDENEVDAAAATTYTYRGAEIIARMFDPTSDYSVGDYVVYLYRLYQFISNFEHTGDFPVSGIRRVYLSDDVKEQAKQINNITYNSANPFNPSNVYIQGDLVIGPNDNTLYMFKTDYGPANWPEGHVDTYLQRTTTATSVSRALNSLAETWRSGIDHPAGDFVIYKNRLSMYTSDNNATEVYLGDILKNVALGLANRFNKANAYYQGDFVIYANRLYRFIKDHPANTNWRGTEGANADVIGATLGTYLYRTITDIAPMFDASHNYSVGDYVVNDYRLYQFTASHSGDWTGSDVRQSTLTSDIPRIKTQLISGDDYKLIVS